MEHIGKILQSEELPQQMHSEEEYILTSEQEKEVIQNAIEDQKKAMTWRMRQAFASEFQIESRLKHTEWEALIDKEKVLSLANASRLQEEWHNQNRVMEREKGMEDFNDRVKRCTADYMFKLMARNCLHQSGKKLIVNEHTKPIITALCFFFSNDTRFESELGFSFSKGLIIRGSCGLGKTFLVEMLKGNELKPVHIQSMIDISEQIKFEGEYTPPIGGILYLDDVGSEEPTVTHFGTKINWFKSFIEGYYLNGKPFNKLMFSTNNSASDLEEKYGFRVRSRLREMFNLIDVTGEDMRK